MWHLDENHWQETKSQLFLVIEGRRQHNFASESLFGALNEDVFIELFSANENRK